MANYLRKIGTASTVALVAASLVVGFANPADAGKGGKGRYRKVALHKGARKNGYQLTVEGDANVLVADKVEDPLTKKLLEGIRQLEYRCAQAGPSLMSSLSFTQGRSQQVRVSCPILIEPQILLSDEGD